jgi:hypothetical protein
VSVLRTLLTDPTIFTSLLAKQKHTPNSEIEHRSQVRDLEDTRAKLKLKLKLKPQLLGHHAQLHFHLDLDLGLPLVSHFKSLSPNAKRTVFSFLSIPLGEFINSITLAPPTLFYIFSFQIFTANSHLPTNICFKNLFFFLNEVTF